MESSTCNATEVQTHTSSTNYVSNHKGKTSSGSGDSSGLLITIGKHNTNTRAWGAAHRGMDSCRNHQKCKHTDTENLEGYTSYDQHRPHPLRLPCHSHAFKHQLKQKCRCHSKKQCHCILLTGIQRSFQTKVSPMLKKLDQSQA